MSRLGCGRNGLNVFPMEKVFAQLYISPYILLCVNLSSPFAPCETCAWIIPKTSQCILRMEKSTSLLPILCYYQAARNALKKKTNPVKNL